ncbi:MAG TPA: 2TM domain-containing protein [Flavobacterium sp.]|nr:2TM domain-containing protein [Flavobacterium sp.]
METILDNRREQEFYVIATRKVLKLKKFYTHLAIYLIAASVYVLQVFLDVPLNFFPFGAINWLVMSIWTTVIVIQAIDIFVDIVIGKRWEERQIKRMLEKKSKKQIWK